MRRTIYCVQSFRYVGESLEPGERLAFPCATEAEEWCLRMPEGHVGGMIWRVRGLPDVDVWDEPELLMSVGVVPRLGDLAEAA